MFFFLKVFLRRINGKQNNERHPFCSVETAVAEVVGYDDVRDGIEHELYVVGVGGASHVAVDLFGGRLVFRLELGLDVSRCFAVLLRT